MEHKIKGSLIYIYQQQGGSDWQQLGRAINWRLRVARHIARSVFRGKLTFDDFTSIVAGLTVQRQIEDELDKYQQDLEELSIQLKDKEIEQDEYARRLELITAAIMLIALLRGAGSEGEEVDTVLAAAQDILDGVGDDELAATIITDDQAIAAALPDTDAVNEFNSELAIAATAGAGLATALMSGDYDDKDSELFSRLAMWATTALGLYAVGQLLRKDVYYRWVYSPLKEHCGDCARLNDQVHTSSEWNTSGWKPKSRSLECHGYRCGCILIESEGPSGGDF